MKAFRILLLSLVLVFLPVLIFAQATQQVDISVEATVNSGVAPPPPPPPPSPPGGGGGIYMSGATKVILKGRAYPLAFITLLKNEAVAAIFRAGASGLFERELSGLPGGNYTFMIFAEDTEGRKSVTLSFTVSIVPEMTTTISGIFLSPTISLTPTQVEKGNEVDILGQAFPQSQVNIFIGSPEEIVKSITSTPEGKWNYKLETATLEERQHQARAQSYYTDGDQSGFSQTLSFLVLKKGALVCKGADLNFDKKVNIIDFSILLYFWGQKNPSNRCADINFDGIVNIIDFSIMMYWWTG